MNNWFTKIRISAALDSGTQLSPGLRQRIAQSDELRKFEEQMLSLDGALKSAQSRNDPPPWLHGWIMRSVRKDAIPKQAPHWPVRVAWASGAVAVLALALLCWTIYSSRRPQLQRQEADSGSFEAASSALRLGNDMAQIAPMAMVAPLSNELDHLNKDLNKTADFLLASLP
jgi:hypothetical protein